MLLRIAEALEARIEELARIVAEETGNAIRTQARPEATLVADIFRYFGGLAGELKGETIPLGEHVLSYTRREPLGVVGAIIPWNAPVLLGALKITAALCAGNTLVLKAAEDAPLGVLLRGQVCQEFLPPGVLNVLTGLVPRGTAPMRTISAMGDRSTSERRRPASGVFVDSAARASRPSRKPFNPGGLAAGSYGKLAGQAKGKKSGDRTGAHGGQVAESPGQSPMADDRRVPVEAEVAAGDGEVGGDGQFFAWTRAKQGAIVADAEARERRGKACTVPMCRSRACQFAGMAAA